MRKLKSALISWVWRVSGAEAYMDALEGDSEKQKLQYLQCRVELCKLKFQLAQSYFDTFKDKGIEAWPEEQAAGEALHWAESDLEDAEHELCLAL